MQYEREVSGQRLASATLDNVRPDPSIGHAADPLMKPLDAISNLADHARYLTDLVASFNQRVYGATPETSPPQIEPVPTGYVGQIERLDSELSALTRAIDRLMTIG